MPLRRARVSVLTTFAVHAVVSGTWAPRIPEIKAELSLDAAELGIALAGLAVGTFAGTRIAGSTIDRVGSRRAVRVALPLLCVALAGPGTAWDLSSLTALFALLGLGLGFLDVAMNAQAVEVERGYARPLMSGIHAFWSAGLLLGSVLGTVAAAAGVAVLPQLALIAAALLPVAIVATRGLLSAPAAVHTEASGTLALWSSAVALLGLVAFSSFAAEGAAADWSAVYVREEVGATAGIAGGAFVAFSIGMTGMRFAGDALATRLGPTALVRLGGLVAGAGLALSLAVPATATAFVGYALCGAGLAPIVPTAFSAAGNLDHARSGAVLGWVVTAGYVGAVVGPIVIGFTADAVGLRAALVFPALLALTAAALAFSCRAAARARP